MSQQITVVGNSGGDWEGLFVNGKLLIEGHSLHWAHVLDALKIKYRTVDADDEWMYEVGSFPNDLSDVKTAE